MGRLLFDIQFLELNIIKHLIYVLNLLIDKSLSLAVLLDNLHAFRFISLFTHFLFTASLI